MQDIRDRGRKSHLITADISDIDRRNEFATRMFQAFGTVDCLVNNAGVITPTRGQDLLDVTPQDFDRVMNVNLRGTFFLTQAVALKMVEEGERPRPVGRSIITVSSGAAGRVLLGKPEYAFSKTCLSLLSQTFAIRLGRHGIAAYEVRPGATRTPMTRDRIAVHEQMLKAGNFPIARVAEPEDVGATIAALAKNGLLYNTGNYVYVDGGFNFAVTQSAPGMIGFEEER
jgi:3-oxoacyl-[acyl-carrier protein] reductase